MVTRRTVMGTLALGGLPLSAGLWGLSAQAEAAQARTSLQWLQRWQQAAASNSFAGTLAVSGPNGNLRSARVWHAVQGGRQIERVDNLAGNARSMFRTDSGSRIFLHDQKLVRVQSNLPRGGMMFPGVQPLPAAQQAQGAARYQARQLGQERVSNHATDVVGFLPQDGLRHGFRFWSEQKSGLLLKWQLLELPAGATGFQQARMLREVAFSDLQIQAPLEYATLQQQMVQTSGYRIEQQALQTSTLEQQGWVMRQPLPGYVVTHCYLRPPLRDKAVPQRPAATGMVTQCVLSDGLSSISLFLEGASADKRSPPAVRGRGATRIVSRSYAGGQVATAMGEVPVAALQALLDGLVRR